MGDLTQGAGSAASASGSPRWNHNSAFYPELVAEAAERGEIALDVGCWDGALLELLAGVCKRVVGVESDPSAAQAAACRVSGKGRVVCGDFMDAPAKVLGWFRRESTYPAMVTAPAKDSLDDIRAAAATLLPGALVRRRVYWFYSLGWTKGPAAQP